MARNDLTVERLRELLHYDADTGVFTWKVSPRALIKVGAAAGGLDNLGYRVIKMGGIAYKAHRLAWLYVNGVWPRMCIDHIDGCPDNNAICNLRDVGPSVNGQNRKRAKTGSLSGKLGVTVGKVGWIAKINIDGRDKYIGEFADVEAAYQAYLMVKRSLHPGCTL
jgi:hypothetical protein